MFASATSVHPSHAVPLQFYQQPASAPSRHATSVTSLRPIQKHAMLFCSVWEWPTNEMENPHTEQLVGRMESCREVVGLGGGRW